MKYTKSIEEAKRSYKDVEQISVDEAIAILQESKKNFKPIVTVIRNPDDPRQILGVQMLEAASA
jgi:hypothetical protein